MGDVARNCCPERHGTVADERLQIVVAQHLLAHAAYVGLLRHRISALRLYVLAMPRLLHVVTHPEVQVRPDVPVPEWSLSEVGRRRAQGLAQLPWVRQVEYVFSSGERKALETAQVLAQTLDGGTVVIEPDLRENDRSSTGFLPPAEFEELAELFFSHPTQSIRGWETAASAQERVVGAVDRCLHLAVRGDVVVVCHGAVGTLLWCRLAGEAVDRRHDQRGQGSWYPVDLDTLRPLAGWQRLPLASVRPRADRPHLR